MLDNNNNNENMYVVRTIILIFKNRSLFKIHTHMIMFAIYIVTYMIVCYDKIPMH